MAVLHLTKKAVDSIGVAEKVTYYFDERLKGFGLKAMPSGLKTFFVEYRPGAGGRSQQKRRMTLGRVGALTPDEARSIAKQILAQVHAGGDPASDKKRQRSEFNVSQLCDLYLDEGCDTKKPSTIATDRGRIERHIKPLLGKKRVSEVTRVDVEKFMRDVSGGKTALDERTKIRGRAIVKGGKGTATRTVGLLGGIMSFAMNRGMRDENPVRGVKRHPDKKGERFLSPAELARLGEAIGEVEKAGGNSFAIAIIRLLALTGARKSEISRLRWREIDLETGYLRLGDSKTGAKLIPLGAPAREVLAELPMVDGTDFVFPASKGQGSFQGLEKVWRRVREAAGMPDLRLHDLRHSFASVGLAGGSALAAIGVILGHADVKTTSRYAHLAADPVREAAEKISRSMHAALVGGNSAEVVHMKDRQKS